MALNGTMVKIETVTVGSGGAANIEFTNIPQTYTDLVIYLSTRHDAAAVANTNLISFNSSTTGFSSRFIQGDGAAASSNTSTAGNAGLDNGTSSTASTFSNNFIYIPNYAGSTNKSFSVDAVQETNATTSYMQLRAGLWSNTAAITSIKISPDTAGRNYVQHSTATLYGISRTTAQIKATGGTVYDDADYVYHLFTSSGTFTPSQNLTCDYLVVAGGGGGASNSTTSGGAGGGGAGGLRNFTNQTFLTANTYTVTVGGGGNAATTGSNSSIGSVSASGGGAGGNNANGSSGGSGGGAGRLSTATTGGSGNAGGYTPVEGYAGGNANSNSTGAGGGGAGGVGNSSSGSGANGGIGSSSYSSWGLATSTGVLSAGIYYYAGGGGGGAYIGNVVGTGGNGGGGNGGAAANGTAATANTGSGGGGAGSTNSATSYTGGAGGSGVVIVRYAK